MLAGGAFGGIQVRRLCSSAQITRQQLDSAAVWYSGLVQQEADNGNVRSD
jgi:hypothetical protein